MMLDSYVALDQNLFRILDQVAAGDSCPTVIFAVNGCLFKSRSGQYTTSLYMWTPTGWQLYYRWDQHVPLEPDLHDLANNTALALATPRQ